MAAKAKTAASLRYSRIDFYRFRGFEFLDSVFNLINTTLGEGAERVKRWEQLNLHQQGLYAWWTLYGEVHNGGLSQYFYNHTDAFIPTLVKFLKKIECDELATLLVQARKLYKKHHKAFATLEPFGEEGLFAQMTELAKLDRPVINKLGRAFTKIEKELRTNFAVIAIGDDGQPIEPKFTGEIETSHDNGRPFEQASVKRGTLSGPYRRYLPDGTLEFSCFYEAGEISSNYWPNGQVKHKRTKKGKVTTDEWFFPSGKLQKRYVEDISDKTSEPVRLWYENGQLAEELHKKKSEAFGPWRKYFEDGALKFEAEHRKGETLIIKNAWDESRQQIVKEGKGIYRDELFSIDCTYALFSESSWIREHELQDGIPHGKSTTWHAGVLWSTDSYNKGKQDGLSTLYYNNGRVRMKTTCRNGKDIKTEEFPKFDHPQPVVQVTIESSEERYTGWREPLLDVYPTPKNWAKWEAQIEIPEFLKEIHERHLRGEKPKVSYDSIDTFNDGIGFFVRIDEKGDVAQVAMTGSSVYSIQQHDVYTELLRKLKFTPGKRGKKKVPSRAIVLIDHTFVEGKPA